MSAFTTLHLTRAKALQMVFKQMPNEVIEDLADRILQDRLYNVIIVDSDPDLIKNDDPIVDQLDLV
jgi:hypothetical protein